MDAGLTLLALAAISPVRMLSQASAMSSAVSAIANRLEALESTRSSVPSSARLGTGLLTGRLPKRLAHFKGRVVVLGRALNPMTHMVAPDGAANGAAHSHARVRREARNGPRRLMQERQRQGRAKAVPDPG